MLKGEIGQRGEDEAVLFLKKSGFGIVQRNYKKPWGEIDIVAQKKGVVYFIEVKTILRKEENKEIEASDKLHYRKIKRFRRVVESYIESEGVDNWQIGVILVDLFLDKPVSVVFLDSVVL
jgi:putative endonuclease